MRHAQEHWLKIQAKKAIDLAMRHQFDEEASNAQIIVQNGLDVPK